MYAVGSFPALYSTVNTLSKLVLPGAPSTRPCTPMILSPFLTHSRSLPISAARWRMLSEPMMDPITSACAPRRRPPTCRAVTWEGVSTCQYSSDGGDGRVDGVMVTMVVQRCWCDVVALSATYQHGSCGSVLRHQAGSGAGFRHHDDHLRAHLRVNRVVVR